MAVYRLGDMVRMRREALGMTQEELIQIYEGRGGGPLADIHTKTGRADGNEICSVQVLRRIENGGVKRVKVDVFRLLMEKMGLLPERIYASLLVTECRGLRLKSEIHVHMNRCEYEMAEKKLQELETMLELEYPRNKQYLAEKQASLAYKRGEMEIQEYLGILFGALRYTIPGLDEIDIAEWPFNMNEFNILIHIVNVYHAMKEREKELELLLKLKKNVERQYMDENHYVVWHTCVLAGLSQYMCVMGMADKAVEYCKTGIEECRKQRILGEVFCLLYDAAWSQEYLIHKGMLSEKVFNGQQDTIKKERVLCKKQLVQGYYLGVAQGDIHGAERIGRLFETYYPEEVNLL